MDSFGFWLSICCLLTMTVVAGANAMVVVWADYRRQVNVLFGLFSLAIVAFGISSATVRLQLWHDIEMSLWAWRTAVASTVLLPPLLLMFTARYLKRRTFLPDLVSIGGIVLVTGMFIAVREGTTLLDVKLENGILLRYDLTVAGTMLGAAFVMLVLWTLVYIIQDLRTKGEPSEPVLTWGILILATGYIFGGMTLVRVPVPLMIFTNTFAVTLMGYTVMNRQVFNPLKERTVELEREIQRRHAVEREIRQLNAQLEERVTARTADLEMAVKELEAFSYSVSHDLRAPLRRIDGFSRALVEDCEAHLDETGKEYLARISTGTQEMEGLIDDILKLSRVSQRELELEEVDLSALVRSVIENVRAGRESKESDIKIEDSLTAKCDGHLVKIALENLVANAVKFTPADRKVLVEFGAQDMDGERAFYLKDRGVGFEDDQSERIFAPFQRLHSESEFEGTGIGLSIVHKVMSKHGGRVWATSEPGKGSTFFFTLKDKGI